MLAKEMTEMNTSVKKGTLEVTGSYICWGLLTIFWDLLSEINSIYVLAQRVIWSMLFMLLYLAVTRQLHELRRIFASTKMLARLFLCGILICINWGVYIYAVSSSHVLDASLGYFLEPIIVTVIGLLVFREKMSVPEKITALFSIVGVSYLIFTYRVVPVMAIVIGLSFAVYGAVKKKLDLRPEVSLFGETLMMTPFALVICIYCELHGAGSLQVFHGLQFLLFPLSGIVTSIPLLLFNRGVKQIPYYVAGLLMYMNPTIQFVTGLLYFRESLEVPRLIAFAFIWIGIGFTIHHYIKVMKEENGKL